MAMTSLRRMYAAAALAVSLLGSCRALDVCQGQPCSSAPPPPAVGGGGKPGAGGGGAEGGALSGSPSNDAGAGTAGAAGDSGAAGDAGLPAPCEGELAECDGSRLTTCETDLSWNVRHCGKCDGRCDGSCYAGSCEGAELIQRVRPTRMLAVGSRTAFADVLDPNIPEGGHSLLQVDLATGVAEPLLSPLSDSLSLEATSDRLYVLDAQSQQLWSARLDGSDLVSEAASAPESLGASARGVYYLTRTGSEGEGSELLFRAVGSSSWERVETFTSRATILSSSPAGALVATYADEYADDCNAALSIWDGEHVTEIGDAPPQCRKAELLRDGSVVVLEHDFDAASSALWWRDPQGAVSRYAIPTPTEVRPDELVSWAEDTILLSFLGSGLAYVQLFSKTGGHPGRRGMQAYSNVVWVDRNHIWYGVWDGPLSARFLRSRWFDL